MTVPANTPSLGAYVLTGDPTWLASSLSRYYDHLDELVVLVPEGNRSWTGALLPVEACLRAVEAVDRRGIARVVRGVWTAPDDVGGAETDQRRAGIEALSACDWILQIDNDEVLPDMDALRRVMGIAAEEGLLAVEWPMRCLYRHVGGARYLQVVGLNGEDRYDYPGPIAVRPSVELVDRRRALGRFLRPVVAGDTSSLQITRALEPDEVRVDDLTPEQAILHNTWGRQPSAIRAKLRSSSHRLGIRGAVYYGTVWRPAPITWRWLRDIHPFAKGLWPRLSLTTVPSDLLHEMDR